MNIIEAAKSGRRFRRTGWKNWKTIDWIYQDGWIGGADVLADDWELEPEPEQKIELTWSEIEKALRRLCDCRFRDIIYKTPVKEERFEDLLKKELGFKE